MPQSIPFDRPITRDTIIDYLQAVFDGWGSQVYLGEAVTTAQHMLQAATLAAQEDAADHEIAAALLHDLGHFQNAIPHQVLAAGADNHHESAGADFLAEYFPATVIEPIRQHVATKRYLCAVETGYFDTLSSASVASLKSQGGPMNAAEVATFDALPQRDACIRVRRWDEAAKDPAMAHLGFADFRTILQGLVLMKRH